MIKYSELKNILKQHKLRVTDCRMDVLEYFIKNNQAFSFKNLEDEFTQYDRVTLYRTLHSFTENGVFHKIPSDTGMITYGVCSTTCSPQNHQHNHMHFQCNCCGKVECLAEDHIPVVKIPLYEVMEVNMILKGVCPQCIA
ncbi:MAG: transcriptional repressor [Cyclobacteriaceae bacterium]|nr:transcriptional repressor [Cyclobacteriaceae bacterium]